MKVEGVAAVLLVLLTIAIAGVATASDAETRTTVFHVDGMT